MNIISLFDRLTGIERWNLVPHFGGGWTEAENIAYNAFIAFGLCTKHKDLFGDTERGDIIRLILLKKLNRAISSDISRKTLNHIKEIITDEGYIIFLKNMDKEVLTSFNYKAQNHFSLLLDRYYSFSKDDHKNILINFVADVAAREELLPNIDFYAKFDSDLSNILYDINSSISNAKISNISLSKSYQDPDFTAFISVCRKLKYQVRWNRLIRSNKTSVMAHSFIVAFLSLYFGILEEYTLNKHNAGFTIYEIIERGLFHDLPEAITGDIITPVKTALNSLSKDGDLIKTVEHNMVQCFKDTINTNTNSTLTKYNLLEDFHKGASKVIFSIDSLVKECDRIALLIECLFELKRGVHIQEMRDVFSDTIELLSLSEWTSIRDFCHILTKDFPK